MILGLITLFPFKWSEISSFQDENLLDQEFNKEFVTTGKKEDKSFEVTNTGSVGIDSDGNLTVEVTDYVPSRLFYKFDTINPDLILENKRGIIIDDDDSDHITKSILN